VKCKLLNFIIFCGTKPVNMGSLPPKHYLTETRKSYATPGVYFGNRALDLMSQGSTLPYTITFPR